MNAQRSKAVLWGISMAGQISKFITRFIGVTLYMLLLVLAPSLAAAQVTSTFSANSGNSTVSTMSLSAANLTPNTAPDLAAGANIYNTLAVTLNPSVTGVYEIGQTAAAVDTVGIVYLGNFAPANPQTGFIAGNDDGGNGANTCGSTGYCPIIGGLSLTQGQNYTFVISTYSPGAPLALPQAFYATGPGSVSFTAYVPSPLSLTPSSLTPAGTVGTLITPVTFGATGGSGVYTSYALNYVSGPTIASLGLSFNTATGSITGTPSATGAAAFTVTVTDNTAATATSSSVTLTVSAGSTYSVTYNGNGNTGGAVPTDGATYANGATVTVLGNTGTLVKTGYTFNGWNTAANGSGTAQAAASTFSMGSAAVTLYAQWTLIPTYSVTYNGNGNTGGAVPTDGATYANGAAVTVLGNTGTLVKTGYTFNGWNTAVNGSGTAQAAASTFAMGSAAVTLYAQWTLIPVVPPANPIPTVVPLPTGVGVGSNSLSPLNLSSGDGPAMTNCLLDTLRGVIGSNAVYQGQMADGGARMGQTGQVISFYALEASTSTGGGSGIHLRTTNPLNVVTSCGTFLTTPAVYNLTEWGTFLNGMGLSAQFNTQGVMTVTVGGTIYVARPDYAVTQGDSGAPKLVTGSDGLLRFTDSAGNTQILYPAFLDSEVLGNQIAQAVSGSTLIQTDGTALVTLLNGQQYVLTPDMTLGDVPQQYGGAGWWQDGPNHYRYRNSSFSSTSQGFTVRPR